MILTNKMLKRAIVILVLSHVLLAGFLPAQEDFLKIEVVSQPREIQQGAEGVLLLRIVPRSDIRISSYPEFMLRFEENDGIAMSKLFFMGSEFNFPTTPSAAGVFLVLDKEIEIPFKVSESALPGKYTLNGEAVFTAFFADNWHLKTFQQFAATVMVRKGPRGLRSLR